ncbi:MAG: hypothetical protein NXI20_13440 [bacterium]|nr:hypothetical protein [bacterium]
MKFILSLDMDLPLEYRWLQAHKFEGLTPWDFFEPGEEQAFRNEYQRETGNDIFPFATRQDNDDIAGFEVIDGIAQSTVLTVHLTWSKKRESPGYPSISESKDLFEWMKEVLLPETQEWMDEDELENLLDDE